MKNHRIPEGLLTKAGAAKLLGVSVSTFDRLRRKKGIQPADTMLEKPVLFYESHIKIILGNGGDEATLPKDRILDLAEIKARARAGRKPKARAA